MAASTTTTEAHVPVTLVLSILIGAVTLVGSAVACTFAIVGRIDAAVESADRKFAPRGEFDELRTDVKSIRSDVGQIREALARTGAAPRKGD